MRRGMSPKRKEQRMKTAKFFLEAAGMIAFILIACSIESIANMIF